MEKEFKISDYKILEIVDNITHIATNSDYVDYGVKMIGAQSEWKETRGKGIKVAVLDTGIDINHPDLKDRVKGGVNFTTSNPNDYLDRQGHGTHCAGIIAATLNNSGVVGVAPEVELYAVKVLGDDGSGSLQWIVKGLDWCIKNGIHIVSISLGSPKGSTQLYETIKRAYDAGIVLIAAAGNEGEGVDTVGYPASYEEVISVAAVDINEQRGSFSSTSLEVDIAAPGVNVLSTYPGNKYACLSGTSMACPHIAGAAAILQSKALIRYKRLLKPQEIRLLLEMYSKDLGVFNKDNKYGFGLFSFDRINNV